MQIIKKISVKTCGASPEMEFVKIDGKDVPRAKGEQSLLRIIGMTNGVKRGTGDYGPWVAFLGSFEATNMSTGEVYSSSVCLMPEAVSGILSVAVGQEDGKAVEFGVDIGAKPENNPIGFTYTITPLIESEETNPLRHLKKLIEAKSPLKLAHSQNAKPVDSDPTRGAEPEKKVAAKK